MRAWLTQLSMRRVALSAVLLLAFYFVASFVHTETYVWQTTQLAHYLPNLRDGPERDECPLRVRDLLGEPLLRPPAHTGTSANSANINIDIQGMYQNTPAVATGQLRIGLIMLFSEGDSISSGDGWGAEQMHRVIRNRVHYCHRHGYVPIVLTTDTGADASTGSSTLDPSRPVAWSKFLAIQRHLPEYDYVAYIDMDAVIMEPSTPLEAFIEATGPCSDVILTEDWNGPNTGVYLVKNSPWSRWFLSHAWELGLPLVSKTNPEGFKHPFQYEQRVVHYLLESSVWTKRTLSKYHAPDAANALRTHVSVLPQCAFNSYSLHPVGAFFIDTHGVSSDVARYVDARPGEGVRGDFLVHFAGKKGKVKMHLLDHYLGLSELHLRQEGGQAEERN